MKRILAILVIGLFAGCATVKVESEAGRMMCDVENNCWYLFLCIPLGSGDPDTPNEDLCCLFRDTVTLKNNVKMLNYAVTRKQAKGAKNVTSRFSDEKYSFLLKRFTCHTSAELIP